jgi:peroxiredoxin Q/BCP
MAGSTPKTSPYPKVGNKAPAFSAPATTGGKVKLADYKGKIVVLYFYPKDNTPGCTKEACGFRDQYAAMNEKGIEVLGISPDPIKAHEKFITKYELPFPLLSDENHEICQKYGVWQEKNMYGKKTMGVARTTFIIDENGKLAHVFEKVKPEGHQQEVLDWIEQNLKSSK